jgi:hypothetical protein
VLKILKQVMWRLIIGLFCLFVIEMAELRVMGGVLLSILNRV